MTFQYRKKPVVIEAFLLPEDKGQTIAYPQWFIDGLVNGTVTANADSSINIKTLEGTHRGDVGDFIIKGIKGELYPCKPDIFEATYDKV